MARVSAFAAVAAACGCASAPEAPARRGSGEWPFAAVRMDVHPLTRLVRDEETGGLRIEAHLEFRDRWGHGTKDVGELRFELYGDEGGGEQMQALVWRLDLRDPAESSARYEQATRTYLVTLDGAPDWIGGGAGPATLLVQFTGLDGTRLAATRRLDRVD